MKIMTHLALFGLIVLLLARSALAQNSGDYRSAASGDWSQAATWETFDGTNWSAAVSAPAGTENITIDGADTVRVDVAITISGYIKVVENGILKVTAGALTFGDGSSYEHARDAGVLPTATWSNRSTFLVTGTKQDAPANRNQNFGNVVFNTPDLGRNRDMGWDNITISGTVHVISTGSYRWQFTSAAASDTAQITILGDVIVAAGQFSVHGTSNALTTFIVDHFGDIQVTGGNFSIARGSQGNGSGTTIWRLKQGNFSMTNATTQNSNPTPGNAKFVFAAAGGSQKLTLSNVTYGGGGLPIQVDSLATLELDTTAVAGSGCFNLLPGATLATAHPSGLDGNLKTTGLITLSKQANYIFNAAVAQVPGGLLPDSVAVLTVANPEGVDFADTVTCAELKIAQKGRMKINSTGSVVADSGMVAGTIVNEGVLDSSTPLVFDDGAVYEHARNGGSVPLGQWHQGSTLLLTGITNSAPANRNQSYYHLTINTPKLASNLDLGLNAVTIGGNLRIENTANSRWRLTSAPAGDTAIVRIMGDVVVETGAFETQGTSNALTVFEVHHYGDVIVTGGNFSVARGSQGNGSGSTRWFLHRGNFSLSNATTQNSNPTNARFVFDSLDSVQHVTLNQVTYGGGGLAIEIANGTTVDFGLSELAGNGLFLLNENATMATAHEGGIAGTVQTTGNIALDEAASYSFNGTKAQVTSALMPAIVKNLVIDNDAGVKLSQPTTINGVLRLKAGEFDNTIPFVLGPGGTISFEGGRLKVPTLVEANVRPIPSAFALHQNYPNPFNPATTIGFEVPQAVSVTLKIFDIKGQEIAELVNGRYPAGAYRLVWDASGLANGVYFCQLVAGDFKSVRKLILMK